MFLISVVAGLSSHFFCLLIFLMERWVRGFWRMYLMSLIISININFWLDIKTIFSMKEGEVLLVFEI